MPSIKNKINEAYEEHRFSKEKQLETLQAIHKKYYKRSFSFMPALSSIGIVFILLLLIFTSTKEQPIQLSSSSLAPYNADEALLDRVHQFQQIVKDGVITEQERRQYISTSDWALQLAFETGTSIFYNRPDMPEENIQHVAELLHNMYYMVYDNVPMTNIDFIEENTTFNDFMQVVATYNAQVAQTVDTPYISSLTEKPFTKNMFLNLDWWWQLLLLGVFVLFVYLLIQNIRIDRKKLAGVFQIAFIVLIGSFFFIKDKTHYSYNETALMETAMVNELIQQENVEVVKLIDIAQFNEGRIALFEVSDGRLFMSEYMKYGNKFKYQGSSMMQSNIISSFGNSSYNEHQNVFAFPQNSNVAKIGIIEMNSNKKVFLQRDDETNIQLFIYPNDMTANSIHYYNEAGEEID